MDLSKPEIHWIIIGCLASIVFGAGTPFFAILFGDMLKLFTYEADEAMKQAKLYIPSTLNNDYLLCHIQIIVCAVKY